MDHSSVAAAASTEAITVASYAPPHEHEQVRPEPHAAIRWARTVVPIVDSPTDPRTIAAWGKVINVSASAVRNWCFTAGIGPRRSLVFGRLLRAVALSERGRHKPENLLDSVDRRTLVHLLRLAGFSLSNFPGELKQFLESQTLVRDADALLQVKYRLQQRRML